MGPSEEADGSAPEQDLKNKLEQTEEIREQEEHAGETVIVIEKEEGPSVEDGQAPQLDCRICLLGENAENLVAPCACDGSLKYAHYQCLEQWSIESRSLSCEICTEIYKQPYKNKLTSLLANAEAQQGRQTTAPASAPNTSAVHWRFQPDPAQPAKRIWCRLVLITILTVALIYLILFIYKGYHISFWTVTVLRIVSFILPFYLIGKAAIALRRYRQERTGD